MNTRLRLANPEEIAPGLLSYEVVAYVPGFVEAIVGFATYHGGDACCWTLETANGEIIGEFENKAAMFAALRG